ncbi:unnamed protein product [Cylindrotheca closterium]|uniref:Uncharacterized protein n=1 Tax=Cylindrotheca closterium TaxID=2856 RepID=A0AAD2FMM5_9STRA|nr:unnamed protein product [Cylindrotheca closterium]
MAASFHLEEDILDCLLDWYPRQILQRDRHGLRPMDYLLWNTASATTVSLIKMILRKTIVSTIASWRGGDKRQEELNARLDSILKVDDPVGDRIQHVHDFLEYAGYYVRLQPTFVLELTMWKWRMT